MTSRERMLAALRRQPVDYPPCAPWFNPLSEHQRVGKRWQFPWGPSERERCEYSKNVLGVDSNFTFQNYISFITMMMLTFGVAFQTPIAVYFLVRVGLVSTKTINQYRRVIIFGAVVISAFATPGDLFSLFALAISLYLLFESGVLLGWLAEKRAFARKRKQGM